MRALAVLAALLLTAAVGASASSARATAPALRVVDLTPITVRGSGFRAGERVRLVLTVDTRHVRTVRASGNGSILAKFGAVYAELCTAFQLRATGSTGTVALKVRKPPASCAALDPVG